MELALVLPPDIVTTSPVNGCTFGEIVSPPHEPPLVGPDELGPASAVDCCPRLEPRDTWALACEGFR